MEDITMVDTIMEDITMVDTIMVDMETMASILAVDSTVDSIKVPVTVEMEDVAAVDHLEVEYTMVEVDLMEEVVLTMVEVELMEEVDLLVEVDLMEEVDLTMVGSLEDFLEFCQVVWEEEVMVAQEEPPTLMWFSRTTRAAKARMESSLVKLFMSKFFCFKKSKSFFYKCLKNYK